MRLIIGLALGGGVIGLMILLVRRIAEGGSNDQPHSRRGNSTTHDYGSVMDTRGTHFPPHHDHGTRQGHGHDHNAHCHPSHNHGTSDSGHSSGDSGGDGGGGDGGGSSD